MERMDLRDSRGHKHKQRSHKRRLLFLTLGSSVLVFALVYAFLNLSQPTVNRDDSSKAAIVDQLNPSYPNSTFWLTANSMFRKAGWLMHYYVGGAINDNVDFYRTLPQHGFRIIILRVHAALNPETGTLALFTSEEWDDSKAATTYTSDFDLFDMRNNRLAKVAVTQNSTAYFGITPNFVKAMKGTFQNSIVIMMGCDGLANTKMAEAFVEKGAKAYVAWTGPVSASHTDAVTEQLLMRLISEKKTIGTAITETSDALGKDPVYDSIISCYPASAGELRADEFPT